MKWSRKLFVCTSLSLAALVFLARAELAPYVQHIDAGSRLESVFFKLTGRRPPSETRPALTSLITATRNDADLYSLRALEAERQLDFRAAESDWQKYAQLATDKYAGQIGLADFYHRRIESAKELAALHAAAMLPNSDQSTFDRIVTLINDQLLGYDTARTEFRAWIQRYSKSATPYTRFLDYAVEHKQYADAEDVLKQYTAAFPNEAVFPVRAQAQIEAARGSTQSALALYERAFQPLWPPELIKSFAGAGDSLPDWIVVDHSPLDGYTRVPAGIERLVRERYTKAYGVRPGPGGGSPVYDRQDAFFLRSPGSGASSGRDRKSSSTGAGPTEAGDTSPRYASVPENSS